MENWKSGKTLWIAIITFGCFVAVAFLLQRNSLNASLVKSVEKSSTTIEKQVPVKLSLVSNKSFLKTVNAYGKVEARQTAFVSPKISGLIEKLYVDEGDYVEKDKTVLFQIDNLKLKQKISNARQNLSIVLAVEKERKAQQKKAQINLSRTSKSFQRYKALFDKKAITQEVFDAHEAEYLTASAELDIKKAQLELGQAEAQQAIINLQMAEKDYADSIAMAPIDGFVSEKLIETGEMGQPGKAVFKIENTSDLEISAYLPAEYGPVIIKNQTEVELSIYGKPFSEKLKVTYKSPVVDPKLHIFEVKCQVTGKAEVLQPGSSVQMQFFIDEHTAPAVPTTSILQSDGGFTVFTFADGVVKKTQIKLGAEASGWTEITGGLKVGTRVVSEGQFLIKDDTSVAVIE